MGLVADKQLPSPRRGDIWLVALGAARKGEMGKTRPCLIISSDALRTFGEFDLITVVPITTSAYLTSGTLLPEITASTTSGLTRDSVVMANVPRAIVPSRFLRQVGTASATEMTRVLSARALIEGWDLSN